MIARLLRPVFLRMPELPRSAALITALNVAPGTALSAALSLTLAACSPGAPDPADLPQRAATAPAPLPATEWVQLIETLSEPGGFFDTDNLISNEASYLDVMPALRELHVHGGAYIGVGPDQNFSYIALQRPELAFIVDVRRDNLLQHLLFKALFTLADTRADYLARLNGVRAPGVASEAPGATSGNVGAAGETIDALLSHIQTAPGGPGSPEAAAAMAAVDSVVATFGLALSADDRATIRRFHETFIEAGPGLQFNSYGRTPRPWYPTYAQLLAARDPEGAQASYLADEADYAWVRDLQRANRVIPIVGDLAGEHALRALGDELRRRTLTTRLIYASNVEFYLVRAGTFDAFAANVATLPVDAHSVLVRSVFPTGLFRPAPQSRPEDYSTQTLVRLTDFVRRAQGEGWSNYRDLVTIDAVTLESNAPASAQPSAASGAADAPLSR